VLLSGHVTPRQRSILSSILDEMPRVAIAAITYGAVAGEWTILLPETAGEPATIEPIGLQITPQRLPVAQYDHLLEVAALADADELDDQGPVEVTVGQVDEVIPVDEPAPPASSMPAIVTPPAPVTVHRHPEYAGFLLPASVLDALSEATPETVDAPATPQQPGLTAASEPAEERTTIEDTPTREEQAMNTQDPAPRILVLGPVEMLHATGKVEPSKKARLLEFAAYLALYPGATHRAIDDAIWPDRRSEDNLNTRNPATSKLRRWLGTSADGEEYLPRHQAGGGYGFAPAVTTDAADWDALIQGNPLNAATEDLEAALKLVRGVPFEATHPKRYAWAEPVRQRLISEIVDTSYELTRRRLMEGRWRAAEQAVVVGLRIEPAQENLWRLRILAAHESRNPAAEAEAIDRLLAITEQLECDLEPATEELLQALKRSNTDFDHLIANAL
jgi:DNA-binding SARP family transcriptional activator